MSSDYDPTDYGVVRFGKGEEPRADLPESDAGVPENMLLQGNAPLPAAPPSPPSGTRYSLPDDSDGWAPLDEPPGDSFSDLMADAPSVVSPSAGSPSPTAPPRGQGVSNARPVSRRAPGRPRAPQVRAAPPAPGAASYPFVVQNRPAQWVIPLVVLNAGIGTGAVLFLFYQSLPLGGIAAMLGVIGGLFARIFLRESI